MCRHVHMTLYPYCRRMSGLELSHQRMSCRRRDEQLVEPTESDVRKMPGDAQCQCIAKIRPRSSDMSWFMHALRESVARMTAKSSFGL